MNDKGRDAVGAAMADRETENDEIARQYLDLAKARQKRMGIDMDEALASTFFVLLYDYVEARRIGERTFTSEFDSKREKGKKKTE
jgi:hypothetical protein